MSNALPTRFTYVLMSLKRRFFLSGLTKKIDLQQGLIEKKK